ncbi:MAG TPA: hypothetical protein VJ914_31285 [Pseudonocardiaceae bacterium]|nr:hypothetical protein [Pseudonocardiaceae bacterium]
MTRAVILICALLMLVTACGSTQSSDPVATITLTIPNPSNLPSVTRAQRISVGQTIAVHVEHTDGPGYWQQVDPGNAAVLAQQGPATTASDCQSGEVGCPSTSELLYLAVKSGSSNLVWHFLGLGPGLHKPGQPSAPCPGDTGQECPVGSFSIDVQVV